MKKKRFLTLEEYYDDVAKVPTLYVDGASRGNPGVSGIGYCICDENGVVLKKGGECIGLANSRVAEYYAMRYGIEIALEMGLKYMRICADNLMMVKQLNGVFKVKNRDIRPIYRDIKRILRRLKGVAIVHVDREMNTIADREANSAIDEMWRTT